MSHPTRMMLALFAALALGGLVEHFSAPHGPAPDRLVRLHGAPAATTWLAALR